MTGTFSHRGRAPGLGKGRRDALYGLILDLVRCQEWLGESGRAGEHQGRAKLRQRDRHPQHHALHAAIRWRARGPKHKEPSYRKQASLAGEATWKGGQPSCQKGLGKRTCSWGMRGDIIAEETGCGCMHLPARFPLRLRVHECLQCDLESLSLLPSTAVFAHS